MPGRAVRAGQTLLGLPWGNLGGTGWKKGKTDVFLDSVVCLKVLWNSSASSPSAEAVLPHAQPLVWSGSSFQVFMQVLSSCGTHTGAQLLSSLLLFH